jgi:hypothetical protein
MRNLIGRTSTLVLRRVLPARGRHRLVGRRPAAAWLDPPTAPLPRVRVPDLPPLSGEEIGAVRPYVLAHEERQRRRQDRYRRSLFLSPNSEAGVAW